jgi:triacylglycerol lipase
MFAQLGLLLTDLKPTLHRGRGPLVLLLHGLYATAGVFGPLRKELESELGVSTFSFTYGFGPGIVELAERVQSHVEDLQSKLGPSSAELYLVGHSLGGLIATYVAHHSSLRARVRGVIALAAPYAGSAQAFLVPGQAGRDIQPGHPLLRLISQVPPGGPACPQLTLVGEDDHLILPGALPAFGEHISLRGAGHNGLLLDPRASQLVLEKLREWMVGPSRTRAT